MKNLYLLLPVVALAAACENSNFDQATLSGATAGAAIGAVANDDDPLEGAVVGGAAGAVAGNLIGKAQTKGDCIYTDSYGNRYVASCP